MSKRKSQWFGISYKKQCVINQKKKELDIMKG